MSIHFVLNQRLGLPIPAENGAKHLPAQIVICEVRIIQYLWMTVRDVGQPRLGKFEKVYNFAIVRWTS
jgi:hypothetical protein